MGTTCSKCFMKFSFFAEGAKIGRLHCVQTATGAWWEEAENNAQGKSSAGLHAAPSFQGAGHAKATLTAVCPAGRAVQLRTRYYNFLLFAAAVALRVFPPVSI